MSYVLRTRLDDDSPWSGTIEYATKRERDKAEQLLRIIGGYRTHSYFETISERLERHRKQKEQYVTQS